MVTICSGLGPQGVVAGRMYEFTLLDHEGVRS